MNGIDPTGAPLCRRDLLRYAGVAATLGVAGGIGISVGSEPAVATPVGTPTLSNGLGTGSHPVTPFDISYSDLDPTGDITVVYVFDFADGTTQQETHTVALTQTTGTVSTGPHSITVPGGDLQLRVTLQHESLSSPESTTSSPQVRVADGTSSFPYTAPSQAVGRADGHYYYNIDDGRTTSSYYTSTSRADGPWILVMSGMNNESGGSATPGTQSFGDPATATPLDGSRLNTNIAGKGIAEMPWTRLMVENDYSTNPRVYVELDATNRQSYNAELRDTSGETSRSGSANTALSARRFKSFEGNTVITERTNTDAIIEVHHGGWNSGSGTNFITENRASRPPGSGLGDVTGFHNHGYGIQITDSGSRLNNTNAIGWVHF